MIIPLVRLIERPGEGILGRMTIGIRKFYTIERNWEGNRKGKSCVPPGRYSLFFLDSPKYGPNTITLYNPELDVYVYESDIPAAKRGKARSRILMHAANISSQLNGCIAPGRRKGALYSQLQEKMVQAVLDSRNALRDIHDIFSRGTPKSGLSLEITEDFTRENS